MQKQRIGAGLDVMAEYRGNYWAARIEKLPIVVYADSELAAVARALNTAVELLARKADLKAYLEARNLLIEEATSSSHRLTAYV